MNPQDKPITEGLYIFRHCYDNDTYQDPNSGTVVKVTGRKRSGYFKADFGPNVDFEGLVLASELYPIEAGMTLA